MHADQPRNEDLSLKYGDRVTIDGGCGATVQYVYPLRGTATVKLDPPLGAFLTLGLDRIEVVAPESDPAGNVRTNETME